MKRNKKVQGLKISAYKLKIINYLGLLRNNQTKPLLKLLVFVP
ncbi:MAG: hypothetical protein WCN86_01705 [bacterium]